jgi:hypothetical protein
MSDYLTRTIKTYLDLHRDDSALNIERRAQLPRAAVSNIFRGHQPPPDRIAKLLAVLDDDTARQWLTAYLLDHTPDEWQTRVHVNIDAQQSTRLNEAPAAYITAKDRLTNALEWLQTRTNGDDELAEWLISTVELMRGMINGEPLPGYAIDQLDGFTEDERAIIAAAAAKERQDASGTPAGSGRKP